MKFQVQAGGKAKTVTAINVYDAIKKAWSKKPPRVLGILIRVRRLSVPFGSDQSSGWQYLESRTAMRIAGWFAEQKEA